MDDEYIELTEQQSENLTGKIKELRAMLESCKKEPTEAKKIAMTIMFTELTDIVTELSKGSALLLDYGV